MIGVRLVSRGRGAFRTECARWIVLAAVLAAGASTISDQSAGAGTKSSADSVDPFLEEDTRPPAGDDIPPVPESESKPRPQKPGPQQPKNDNPATGDVPRLEAPRLPREIKQTAKPKHDSDNDLELPPQPAPQVQLPAKKHQPLEGRSGWKSTLGDSKAAGGARPRSPGDPESSRFEQGSTAVPSDEPLARIVIEGNKTIKAEEIRKLIKTRPGRVADPKLIKEDTRTLLSKGWFYGVEPRIAQTADGPALVFRVREKPVLQKITFKGNHKIKDKELLDMLIGLRVGQGYDVGANREAARRIEQHYQEKGYLHAKVELEKGDSLQDREVVFCINEGPKVVVSKISFSGNKFVSGPVLKTQVKTRTQILWLFGGKYDESTIPEDVNALKTYYHNLGFFDVAVTPRQGISDDKARVHLEYVIEEGERYKIREIEFVGNRVIPEEKLRADMKVRMNDFYNERFVAADKEKIVAQYGELGRIFAKVEYTTVTHEEPGSVKLVYHINEDRPWRIGKINVNISANGAQPHTKRTVVLRTLLFKPGDLANKSKIDKSEQRLKNIQVFAGGMPGPNQQQGAPPSIHLDPSTRQLASRQPNLFRGQESTEPARADRPAAAGAGVPAPRKRAASRARKTAPKSEPDPVSEPEPDRTGDPEPEFIRQRGLFDPVPEPEESLFEPVVFRGQSFPDPHEDDFVDEPSPDGMVVEEPPPGYLDVGVNVTETQTGRINFGVGINSNMGFMGTAVLEENNFDLFRPPRSMQDVLDGVAFRGGGQQFRIEAMPGLQSSLSGSYPVSRYVVSWRDPYFLDQNVSLGVSGSYYTRFQPNWIETRSGGRVALGRQFTPYLSGTLALEANNVNISNPSVPTPAQVSSLLGNNLLSTFTASLAHDTRDSPFLPGRGHYVDVNYQQGIANFVYPKVFADAKQYFLVRERPDGGSRHIISLSGTVGWTGDQTPFFERFYSLGFQNFRGFQYYGVTPRENGFRVGGNFEALGSVEFLVPITADNMIQVATFTDFGTIDSSVTLDAFRISVGAGFRIMVPMMGPVPLAVDFTVPLRRQSFDTTQVISFGMYLMR